MTAPLLTFSRLPLALLSISAISTSPRAQASQYGGVTVFPATCSQVQTVATDYLKQHGVNVGSTTADVLSLKGERLRDGHGKRIVNTFSALKKYTLPLPGSVLIPSWMTYNQLKLSGTLRLTAMGQACQADLQYQYRAFATQWVVVVPADGGWESFTSNHRLESEHLLGIRPSLLPENHAPHDNPRSSAFTRN